MSINLNNVSNRFRAELAMIGRVLRRLGSPQGTSERRERRSMNG